MKKQITKTHALTPDPSNPNRLDPADKKRMARSLDEFGDLSGVILNRRTGLLVGGHQRVDVLAGAEVQTEDLPAPEPDGTVARGWLVKSGKRYALRVVDWDETKAHAALLAANRFGRIGKDDDAALRALLDGLEADGFDLELAGYTAEALAEAGLRDDPEGDADAEPQIDRAEELNQTWGVKPGDLWLIGSHRLVCGDSTKAEDVGRATGGVSAQLVFTDPPYGVAYSGQGKSTSLQTIENDDLDPDVLREFLLKAFQSMPCSPGCNVFVCHADQKAGIRPAFESAFIDAGFHFGGTMIWVKNVASMGWQDFRAAHEPILFGWKDGGGRVRVGDRSLTTVWNVGREGNYLHPTTKPVELVSVAIRSCSLDGMVVFDPFLGSGTTMVAAQNLSRKCYGLEISPAYCAVILQRMADAFPGIDIRKAD